MTRRLNYSEESKSSKGQIEKLNKDLEDLSSDERIQELQRTDRETQQRFGRLNDICQSQTRIKMKFPMALPLYILTLLATSCFVSGSPLKRKEDPMEKETEFVKPMKDSSLNRKEDPIEKDTEFVKPVMGSSLKRKEDPPMEKDTEIVKPMMDEFAEELLQTVENIEEAVDPCPGDWSHFSEYCYHVSSSPRNQREARSFCQSLGGDLVKIASAEENEFVLYLARKFAGNGKPAWIGLFWDPESKAYYWTDRSVPTYTNWAPDEPNGFAKEPCAEMYTGSSRLPIKATGYWNDVPCTPKYNTVCKKLA